MLALSIIILLIIVFISRTAYEERFATAEELGIAGLPNVEMFQWLFPFSILMTSLGFYFASQLPGVIWRWGLFLFLLLVISFSIFGVRSERLLPLAFLSSFALVILLGESIYHIGVRWCCKRACALLGFMFAWSIYILYLVTAFLMFRLNRTCTYAVDIPVE